MDRSRDMITAGVSLCLSVTQTCHVILKSAFVLCMSFLYNYNAVFPQLSIKSLASALVNRSSVLRLITSTAITAAAVLCCQAVACVFLVTIELESGIQIELQTGRSPSLVYCLAAEWNTERYSQGLKFKSSSKYHRPKWIPHSKQAGYPELEV